MKNNKEKIIVQLTSPDRKFSRIYHDFLCNSFLSTEEQMIFIVLKSFIDFKEDSGEAFPSMETICKMAKMSEKRARKNIKSLEEKGIIKKIRRGLNKSNIYTIADYPAMWACDNAEDAAAIANNQGIKPLTPAEHIAELERMGYKVEIKEKGLETEPSKAQNQAPIKKNIAIDEYSTKEDESQGLKRYTINQIKQLFDYDAMLQSRPDQKQDIDAVMGVLHNVMNASEQTICIAGQDKPATAVISKFMKLDKESILYAVKKFSEQTDRIKNPAAYLLTILYAAREQYYLDMKNKTNSEKTGTDHESESQNTSVKHKNTAKNNLNDYCSYPQRTYDYEALEKQLTERPDRSGNGPDDADIGYLLKNCGNEQLYKSMMHSPEKTE